MKKFRIMGLVCLVLSLVGCLFKAEHASCLFCQASKGLVSNITFYNQNNKAMVIKSLSGGVLAIPRQHIESLKFLNIHNLDDLAHVFLYAAETAQTIFPNKYYQKAYFHTGPLAGQTQFHVHMHMVLSDTLPTIHSLPAKDGLLVAQNDHVYVFCKAGKHLFVRFRQPILPLKLLDKSAALRLSRALLFVSEYIASQYPTKDYKTTISDAFDSNGKPTLTIQIDLFGI